MMKRRSMLKAVFNPSRKLTYASKKMLETSVDIIITALSVEYNAVIAHLKECREIVIQKALFTR